MQDARIIKEIEQTPSALRQLVSERQEFIAFLPRHMAKILNHSFALYYVHFGMIRHVCCEQDLGT